MRKARSPSEIGLSRHDERRLKKMFKQTESKPLFQRVQAVLLVAQGRGVREGADIAGVSVQTVYIWIKRYLKERKATALEDAHRSGRPQIASHITSARILRELRRNPLKLGYRTTTWTVKLLAHQLSQRFNCVISPYTLRRRMKAMGLRCKRPRYAYEEKDPHRAQKKGPLSAV